MRHYIYILTILILLIACRADAEVAVNLERETLELLEKSISRYQNEAVKKMPDKVRSYLSGLDKPKSIHDLKDEESIRWIHTNIIHGGDADLEECIEKLISSLALSGDKVHGDDISSMLEDSFFALLNSEDFDLEKSIRNDAIYWREHSKPSVKVSPDGLNTIDWIWELAVESREHGVLHVGIDEKKRTFICYEHPVGVYFPEGETMERIYREIVQDPDMARHYIGVGRKHSNEPTIEK
jgi:hypothetical protein